VQGHEWISIVPVAAAAEPAIDDGDLGIRVRQHLVGENQTGRARTHEQIIRCDHDIRSSREWPIVLRQLCERIVEPCISLRVEFVAQGFFPESDKKTPPSRRGSKMHPACLGVFNKQAGVTG